jgi:hypothetical protein
MNHYCCIACGYGVNSFIASSDRIGLRCCDEESFRCFFLASLTTET